MDTALETNTNDEIQVLRLKLEVVEKELQFTINRAEKAETELEQFKQLYKIDGNVDGGRCCRRCGALSTADDPPRVVAQVCAAPPPPPPPPFNLLPTNFAPHGTSLSDGIASITLNHMQENGSQQVKQATGRHIEI